MRSQDRSTGKARGGECFQTAREAWYPPTSHTSAVATIDPRKKSSARRKGASTLPRIQGRALSLGSQRVPLYAGSVHYWRLSPDAWPRALQSLKTMGLELIDLYIPWGPHETAPGQFDLGSGDPRLDVGAFLDLIHEMGLFAFVRPGPHINAELTHFGIPERICYDRACQARSPRQNPVILPWPPRMFPVPSYASREYHREAGRWFDAVAPILAPRRYPEGPVVLLQVDNEATYFFRNGPYDQDYHPDAIRLYRKQLKERFETVEEAEGLFGGPPPSSDHHPRRFDDVEPPTHFDATGPEDLLPHLEWAEFQERLVTWAIAKFRRRLVRAGIKKIPTVHNLPLGEGGLPVNPPALANEVDLVGLDYYHAAREHRAIKRRTLYLAGTFPFPFAPEMGVGAPPWFTPLHPEDSLYCSMCALAYGLRGFNLYMAVDRDRWYGAPVDAEGTARPEAGDWTRLLAALKQTSFHELDRHVEVGLQIPAEYQRLSRATHLLGGMLSPSALEALGGTPVDGCREDPLGFKGPIQVLWWRMLAKLSDALTRAQIPYVYLDSEAPLERLKSLRLILAPTYEFVDEGRWERLSLAAEAGVRVVTGPAAPRLDQRLRPRTFDPMKGARTVLVDTPEDADRLIRELAADGPLSPTVEVSPTPLEATVHRDRVGPRVVFVLNPGRQARTATLRLPMPLRLEDAMTGEDLGPPSSVFELPVQGLSARMLLVSELASGAPRDARRPSARRGGR